MLLIIKIALTSLYLSQIAKFKNDSWFINSNPFNLKTPLCTTSTFKASYFNPITKLWNFVHSLKSPSSFSSTQSFKQFVYKTMFTTLVNTCTYEVERSCTWTLVTTCPCHRLKRLCLPPPLSCTFFFYF